MKVKIWCSYCEHRAVYDSDTVKLIDCPFCNGAGFVETEISAEMLSESELEKAALKYAELQLAKHVTNKCDFINGKG